MNQGKRKEDNREILNPMQPVMEVIQGADREQVCQRYGITLQELEKRLAKYQAMVRQQALADQFVPKKVGRNDPCPCGSGKKYKKCCMAKHEEARRSLPPDQLREMEERARKREKLEKEIAKGFDLLASQNFRKARMLAEKLLESFPEDDRLHDILVSTFLATGDYDKAFYRCRNRWQVALEEKEFYQENGYHKREGLERNQMVHFYSPGTWLEKFWIAQRARVYEKEFPTDNDSRLQALSEKLRMANDIQRFPERDEEGIAVRKAALQPVLSELETAGPRAVPYLLPLTYHFSWASLFVPELLDHYGTPTCVRLLAELSMFRFPYFAQICLTCLEKRGEDAFPQIAAVINENPAFDELKVGLIMVLGTIHTPESFNLLVKFTEHENPYLVNWTAQALGRHQNPEALQYLKKAQARLGKLSKIAGAIKELAATRLSG